MKDVGQGMSHNMSKGENLPQSQPGCSLQYPTIVADGLDHADPLFIRGGIWLQSQRPSTRVYGDYSLIIAINSSFSVNNRTHSAAECHLYYS